MPLDPSISLDAGPKVSPLDAPGAAVRPPASTNPLSLVQGMAETANSLNQVRLFQQTFQARQRAGQIMATAPDLQSGVSALQQDPSVMGFAPDIASTSASMLNAMQQYKGQVQTQTGEAFTHITGLLPAMLEDPKSFAPAAQAYINTVPDPTIRAQLLRNTQSLEHAITDDLPSDPGAARAEMAKRIIGLGVATGSADAMSRLWRGNAQISTGGQILPGQTQSQFGPGAFDVSGQPAGSFAPSGNSLEMTLPPQLTEPGKVPVGGAYGAGGGQAQAEPPPTSFTTSTGTEIPIGKSPALGTGTGGGNVLMPAQQVAAEKRMGEWAAGSELHAFQNNQATLGLLAETDRDLDTMAKGGGFLVPGSFIDQRASIAKGLNTIQQMQGKEPLFDSSKIGAAEEFVKDTRRMGITLLTTMLGNQREAAATIDNITKAVPSASNSYLGGKIIIGTLRAAAQRAVDMRNFENSWQQQNQGNLTGADEAFNAAAPMTSYTNKVLDDFGIDSQGFKSSDAVISAVKNGYLTKKQGADILKREFPGGPGARAQ